MASIEVEIEDQHVEAVRCNTTLPTSDEAAGLVFIILPLAGYLVAPGMNLEISFVVEKITGSGSTAKTEGIAATDKIALVNYPLMSMWKTIEMEINQKQIIPVNTLVPYASLIRAYQEYDADARNSKLALSGWYADDANMHETFTISEADNPGFYHRHTMIQDSKDCFLYGPVMLGPLRQSKPFVDDAEIVLTFSRQPTSFFLVGDVGTATNVSFRVTIKKATLYIKRLKMRPGTRLGKEVGYSFTSYETRHFMVASGGQGISEDILRGPCPNRGMAVMVSQKGFFGELKKNPHNFPSNLLASVYIKKDQMTNIPGEIYTTEAVSPASGVKFLTNYSRFYVETMEVLNDARWLTHSTVGIDKKQFLFGTFIMAFDFRSFQGGNAPAGDVVLRFEAAFHENLKEQFILIVIFEYDRTLVIPTGPGRSEVYVS